MGEHILLLTGRLAEKSLRRVMQTMAPREFTYEVLNIGVSVAALMTAEMIARRLGDSRGASRIIVPGLCTGDLEAVSSKLGVRVERGPIDLKDLPAYLGGKGQARDLGRHRIQIFAEVVDAPRIGVAEILQRAADYRRDGADVIDLGCLPGTPFPHLEEAIAALREGGYLVSVDSMDIEELRRAGRAGADYLLSLKESTLALAEEFESVPVVVPEQPQELNSLYGAIETLSRQGRRFIADCILDPVHFGFTASIVRYWELRRRYPEVEVMLGAGNVTELTEADTSGMNMLLAGIMSELDIQHVLTTQVSPHACASVRELDRARRVVFAARQDNAFPKGYDGGLTTTHERRPFPYTVEEIREWAAMVRDPSYRVQVTAEGIHVYNRDGHLVGTDPYALFPELKGLAGDAGHAFYMGVELARAQIAWQLGKRYVQDEELDWGCAVPLARRRPPASLHAYKAPGATMKGAKKGETGS